MKPHFEIAEVNDAQVLTLISISAFHTDFEIAGRSTKGGPPGYDSVEFHKKMIEEATKFFNIVVENTPIGAFWFCRDNSDDAYLYRLFIDPKYHRKGIGIQWSANSSRPLIPGVGCNQRSEKSPFSERTKGARH